MSTSTTRFLINGGCVSFLVCPDAKQATCTHPLRTKRPSEEVRCRASSSACWTRAHLHRYPNSNEAGDTMEGRRVRTCNQGDFEIYGAGMQPAREERIWRGVFPTVDKSRIRMIAAIACEKDLDLWYLDVQPVAHAGHVQRYLRVWRYCSIKNSKTVLIHVNCIIPGTCGPG